MSVCVVINECCSTEKCNVLVNSQELIGRAETECDGTRKRTGGEVKGKKANGGGSQQSCTVSDTVYHYR